MPAAHPSHRFIASQASGTVSLYQYQVMPSPSPSSSPSSQFQASAHNTLPPFFFSTYISFLSFSAFASPSPPV